MNVDESALQPNDDHQHAKPFREILTDAIRYWEPRRIAYNVILTLVVLAWITVSWPHFRPIVKFEGLVLMAVLAVWANICYCAAYLADVPMQFSFFRQRWLRWRWGLWTGGMLFAILLANYWIADEIFPYVH
jgi:hypothetical protein